MASYTFIDTTGIIIPDTSDTIATVSQEFKDALGQDMDTDPKTPQGVLIVAEVSSRDSVARNNAFLANQTNPNYSSGRFLDALCSFLGLERDSATFSTVAGVVLTGTPLTLVPAGSRATTLAGDMFELLAAVTLSAEGVATGTFQATLPGPIPCSANTFEQPADMVLGWETVSNPIAGTVGQGEQTDASLRRKRNDTLALQGISSSEAVLSAVRDVDGVAGAVFRENYTNLDAIIDGIFLLEKSVWTCVDGGADADIARALLENKSSGSNWNGAVLVPTLDNASGQTYPVRFDRVERVSVYVRVTIRMGSDTSNPSESVPAAIINWANGEIPNEVGLPIGVSVSVFELANGINYYHPGMQVVRVEVRFIDGSFSPNELSLTLRQRATIEASFVSVVIL